MDSSFLFTCNYGEIVGQTVCKIIRDSGWLWVVSGQFAGRPRDGAKERNMYEKEETNEKGKGMPRGQLARDRKQEKN